MMQKMDTNADGKVTREEFTAFFVARFLVGLRSPFYLTAGILRVKYRWFLFADFICASIVIGGFVGLAYLFGDRITVLIQKAERGLTAFVLIAVAVAIAVIAFFSFRQRRIRMLDQNPESLFENREILLGPAADRIGVVEGWIDDLLPDGDRIRIQLSTADRRSMSVSIERSLLEQSAVFQVLNDLRGRFLKVVALQRLLSREPVVLETPHQLEIRD